MFSNKQSDIFYNDETKEMFVCTVSSISAERCEDNTIVYGALPLIYKINKADNYKKLVYPKNIDTFSTDPNSDIYKLTPTCAIAGSNFNSITKPLINYNKTTSRYSVTFLGRYSTDTEGLGLNNYIFQDINSDLYLLDANIYIPKDKDVTADTFTFESGHLNSDLYVVGNTVRNDKPSWFNPANETIERSTDYQIAPMYVQATSSLGFNLALGKVDTTVDNLIGDIAFPFMYSGGFITYDPKYVAYDPEYTIRVDFTARSFNVPDLTAYGSTQSVGQSATRWVQQWGTNVTPGEGFCVSFFKNPPVSSYVIPNGIGSTLGYAKAGFSSNEVVGTSQATDGLYVHNNWSPNTGSWKMKRDDAGSFLSNINTNGYLGPAESFLGVGFDIGGNFATTSEEKDDWYDGNSNSWTATPCSIGIRGSSYYDTQVLTAIAMSATPGATVPMHTSAANAQFVDYRIDLSNKGNTVTVYNKLTSATDYNTILEYRLNKAEGTNENAKGGDTTYQPWYDIQTAYQKENNILPPLNVGLSFTTSGNVSRFELYKFEVTGVKVNNPWVEKKEPGDAKTAKRIDYLQESSKNLRKNLLNVESDDLVDVEMVVPAKNIIANTINEETNKPQITMCEGSSPEIIEEDVDIKITGINPNQIDKTIQVVEGGVVPKIPDAVTTIKYISNQDYAGGAIAAADKGQGEVHDPEYVPGAYNKDRLEVKDGITFQIKKFFHVCRTSWDSFGSGSTFPQYWLYKSNDIEFKNHQFIGKTYNIYVNGTETATRGNLSTITLLLQNPTTIEEKFIEEVKNQPDVRYWELKLFEPGNRRLKLIEFGEKYNSDVDDWFFEPLPLINGQGQAISKEKLEEILETYSAPSSYGGDDDTGERGYFFNLGICKLPSEFGVDEPTKSLDQTGDPYFAATTGGDSGAKCIKLTMSATENYGLVTYLQAVASDLGRNVEANEAFESIEDVTMEIPEGSGQIVNVVQLIHSGGSRPGWSKAIIGTGICYYMLPSESNGKNAAGIRKVKGIRT